MGKFWKGFKTSVLNALEGAAAYFVVFGIGALVLGLLAGFGFAIYMLSTIAPMYVAISVGVIGLLLLIGIVGGIDEVLLD